jgi:outer membrane scaffolding protein for murein synthesis (MipA/OmpV family)
VYTPSAGFSNVSFGLIANYLGMRHWRWYVSGGMNYLLQDASNSGVVSSKAQFRTMFGFAYLFG